MKSIVQIFVSRRMFVMLLLGFSAGIPYALTAGTLQAWLATEKVDVRTIGLFALVGIPYNWKFIWAPFMDRYFPRFLGRRRGWMLVTQIFLAAAIAGMALTKPAASIRSIAILATLVTFFAASQDIVIDAYRTELLPAEEYGPGSGTYVLGYRLAMLVAGALALILADHYSWKAVYLLMSATIAVGVIGTLIGPEPITEKPPRTLRQAVIEPLKEFFSRPGAWEILVFILLYKLDTNLATALQTKFFIDLGFTKTEIGAVTKLFGMIALTLGTVLGAALIPRVGLKRSLIGFGIFQGSVTLLYYMMVHLGANRYGLIATITGENLGSGLGLAAYSVFLMSLCNHRYTAMQYALLTSLMAVPTRILTAPSGYLQASLGWQNYFLVATIAALPGLAMLMRYDHWEGALAIAAESSQSKA